MGIKGISEAMHFSECIETADHGVEILRIVLLDPGFDPGGIEDRHVGKFRGDLLADGFREIHKAVEDYLKIITKSKIS